jgi:hypothetical protein
MEMIQRLSRIGADGRDGANARAFDPPLRILGFAVLLMAAGIGTAAAQARTDIAAMCKDRKPCTLVKATPAGTDAQGRALTVVELNLGTKNPDNDGGDERFNCRPYAQEYWLRVAGVAEPRRLLSLCNDGYGASGVGEDDVKIRANRMIHSQQGGSAWRWNGAKTIQLSPLRVLSEESCSYHNVNIGYSVRRWDWQRLAGEQRWFPQACKDNDPRADENRRPDWCDVGKATHRHALIPRLDGALSAGSQAHLGSCASAFDESGQRGTVIFGKPRPGGAEFRVLMVSGNDLVVTVTDTAFATGAASWLNDDHIELWLGQDHSNLSCHEAKFKLVQWAIGLDGKVHHGAGDRAAPPEVASRSARSVGGRQQVTLHLRLPTLKDPEDYLRALTVVYSKSEGGKQARLTATSPIKRGDDHTLSSVHRIDAKGARCAIRDGQLDLVENGLPAILGER